MSKQHGAQTMFSQSIVYLFNSYVEQGMSLEQASLNVTKDIEEIYSKHLERGIVAPSSVLMNPVTKLDKALDTINKSVTPLGVTPGKLDNYYKGILRSVEMDVKYAKQLLEK